MPLQTAAEAEIRRTGFGLTFAEDLERRYRRDTATSRSHELRTVSRVGLAVFLSIGVVMNLCSPAHPSWKASVVYWGLLTAIELLAQTYFRPTTPFLRREGAVFGFSVAYSLSALALVSTQPHPLLFEPYIFATLPIYFTLIFVRMPFSMATMLAVVTGTGFCAVLCSNSDVSLAHKEFVFGFLLALTVPTLVAAHWLERASRRLYLHGVLQRLNFENLVAQNVVLTDLSYTDPLTGVANRRRMDGELQRLCDRDDTCATFMIIDIDWFSNFNERYGHPVGDRCLQEVATCLSGALRGNDLLARLGGEEFGVLLPTMPLQEAVLVAERLRAAVAAYPFMVGTRIVRMTVSVGVASIVAYDEPARVIETADKAMYRAKRAGRNRIGGPWLKVAS